MKYRHIDFNTEEVKATLAGRKTMFRRPIKNQPGAGSTDFQMCRIPGDSFGRHNKKSFGVIYKPSKDTWLAPDKPFHEYIKCPFGQPGDRLWVREAWGESGLNRIEYKAFPADNKDFRAVSRWIPSIHMPRELSRLTLEITDVRIERLQEISYEDALKEGCSGDIEACIRADQDFSFRWSQRHGKFYPWESNPWVWVISFKKAIL